MASSFGYLVYSGMVFTFGYGIVFHLDMVFSSQSISSDIVFSFGYGLVLSFLFYGVFIWVLSFALSIVLSVYLCVLLSCIQV